MHTRPASARHDLTDDQWNLLKPLLPAQQHLGRPRSWCPRSLVNGILFQVRTGIPWRDLPERYGPWWRVYDLFTCYQRTGVWSKIHTQLLSQAHQNSRLSWEFSVDSTTSRGHVHATGTPVMIVTTVTVMNPLTTALAEVSGQQKSTSPSTPGCARSRAC